MIQALARLAGVIPRRRRWQGALLLALMLLGGVLEMLTLGAVVPFLAAVGSPRGGASAPPWIRQDAFLSTHILAIFALVFAAMALAAACVRVALAWATQKYTFRLGYDLEVQAYRLSLARPYIEQVRINSSETISVMEKVGAVSSTVFLPALMGISSGVIALFILAALVAIRPLEAIIALGGFALAYLGISLVFRGRLAGASRTVATEQKRRMQALQEGLGGIRDIILDQSQALYAERFAEIDLAMRDAQTSIGVIGAAPRFVIEGAGMIVISLLVVWLSMQPGGVLSALPLLGALALAAQRLLPLLQQIYNSWSQVAGHRQTLSEVADALGRPLPPEPASDFIPLPFAHAIRLEDVAFRYATGERAVLQSLDLEIRKGDRIGLVGRSGSGKSTVMDLILGLLAPDEGSMSVDGAVLDESGRARWRRQVAHVPQAIYLSDASIMDNIAFGAPAGTVDEARVRDAARRADLADYIETLPRGYGTVVGERGVRLSGGQRQRIGIARALYKGSDVLVLDEATSALDDATETSVLDAIDGLDRTVTIVMVAHRLETLRRCDRICQVADGRLIEENATIAGAKATMRSASPTSWR